MKEPLEIKCSENRNKPKYLRSTSYTHLTEHNDSMVANESCVDAGQLKKTVRLYCCDELQRLVARMSDEG